MADFIRRALRPPGVKAAPASPSPMLPAGQPKPDTAAKPTRLALTLRKLAPRK